MTNIAMKSGRNAAPASGPFRRAWRGLVRTFGRLPDYLVGPAPWEARSGRPGAIEGSGEETESAALPIIPASPEPGWPGGVEVIRLKGRPRTLTGAR